VSDLIEWFFIQAPLVKKRTLDQISAAEGQNKTAVISSNSFTKKQPVRFKFSQGFSAAVKRPVSISEFLS
jgi:hypothetical protein